MWDVAAAYSSGNEWGETAPAFDDGPVYRIALTVQQKISAIRASSIRQWVWAELFNIVQDSSTIENNEQIKELASFMQHAHHPLLNSGQGPPQRYGRFTGVYQTLSMIVCG